MGERERSGGRVEEHRVLGRGVGLVVVVVVAVFVVVRPPRRLLP